MSIFHVMEIAYHQVTYSIKKWSQPTMNALITRSFIGFKVFRDRKGIKKGEIEIAKERDRLPISHTLKQRQL